MYRPDGIGPVAAELPIESAETPHRSACLVAGCPCKDARFVSHRRAAFFAALARSRGESADRTVPVEPGWSFDWIVAEAASLADSYLEVAS